MELVDPPGDGARALLSVSPKRLGVGTPKKIWIAGQCEGGGNASHTTLQKTRGWCWKRIPICPSSKYITIMLDEDGYQSQFPEHDGGSHGRQG